MDPHATSEQTHDTPHQPRHGLADFLVDRDVACPTCGFNLRGLAGNRCPECSARIQLVIAHPDALWALRPWIVVASLALAASVGVNLASHITILVQYGSFSASPGPWVQISTTILLAIVFLALLVSLVRYAIRRNVAAAPSKLLTALLIAIVINSTWSACATAIWWIF